MAQLALAFAISYITNRLTEPKAPRLEDLTGFKADYGGVIPLLYGPTVRTGETTVIWCTEIRETVHKHKPGMDFLFGLIGALLPKRKTYSYSIDFAVLLGGNEISRVLKVWAQGKLIFDVEAPEAEPPDTFLGGLVFAVAQKTQQVFSSMRVYLGGFDQEPDPTIEADLGVGNVPGYRGSAYVVFDDFQLESFGNGLPSDMEFLVEEAATGDLRRIVGSMIRAAGLEENHVSTSSLDGEVRGFMLAQPVSVADSFQDLMTAFNFDAADIGGGLRFIPRGGAPRSVVIDAQLGGHQAGQERPEKIRFRRTTEIGLPREAALTFPDPDRDFQPNTAIARRNGGSSEQNISVAVSVVLTPDEAQKAVDRLLWRAWSARAQASTTVDDRRNDLQAGQVHTFETPNGPDTYLITSRRRGANNVIELDLVADRPLLYGSDLPGIPAETPAVTVQTAGELNDPIFIEPPDAVTGEQPTILIALSGLAAGGATFDPNWPGVFVYVSTDDSDFRQAGFTDAAAYMGELTDDLPAYGGANPDTGNTLSLDLSMSGGVLETISTADAAAGLNLCYVDGEICSFETATATGPYTYDATDLYRGLFGTADALHVTGAKFAMIDQALYRFVIPPAFIGSTLYFKFPQPGQALADVPSWSYAPTGAGFGTGTGGVPATPTGFNATPGSEQVTLTWSANPAADNVTAYRVKRAAGTGAAYGSAVQVFEGNALGWTDIGLSPATGYTYFLEAVNLVGAGGHTAGEDATTNSTAILGPIYLPAIYKAGTIDDGEELLVHAITKASRLEANMSGCHAGGRSNATGSTVVTLKKALAASPNTFSTTVGTITIGAGGTTATLATTGGLAQNFAAGDRLLVVGPTPPDATFAGFHASIQMTRTA